MSVVIAKLLWLAYACGSSSAYAEVARIWAIDDGTKVLRDDLDHRHSRGNLSFDKKAGIKLFAAVNETIAFQLILQGGKRPTPRLSVELNELGAVRNAPLTQPNYDQWMNRPIKLFLQHYVDVKQRSHTLAWQARSAAEPKVDLGMTPDALIPLQPGQQFSLPPRVNQGIWIDIYVPKGTKAGQYSGVLQIRRDGRPCHLPQCRLAINLEVLPFQLHDKPAAKTMVWFSGGDNDRDIVMARYFADVWEVDEAAIRRIRRRHFQLARRHRLSLFLGDEKEPNDQLKSRLSGKIYTESEGYQGPASGVGQDFYAIYAYGWRQLDARGAQKWRQWVDRHGLNLDLFYYAMDEPRPENYPELNRRVKSVENIVPSFTTAGFTPEIDVNIFTCLPNHYSRTMASAAKAAGKRLWVYNGILPYSGSYMIDDVAISPRVNPWIQFKFAIERWFYWNATYYRDTQGGRGHINVFNEANNFRNGDGDRLNGDGLLIYPGRDVIFPQSDQHIEGPLPSIRLKNWRRGVQDVDYLRLAKGAGLDSFVDQLVAKMLPKALGSNSLDADDFVSWPEDGQNWLRARRLLADAIVAGKPVNIPDDIGRPAPSATSRATHLANKIRRRVAHRYQKWLLLVGFIVILATISLLIFARKRRT